MGTVETRQAVWIVQKLDWKYNDNWHELEEDTPVKAFADREFAQIYCDELTVQEQNRWATYSAPYEKGGTELSYFFGGLSRMTTLDDTEFVRGLQKCGLPVPLWKSHGNNPQAYRDMNEKWWATVWKMLPAHRRSEFWGLFDLIQFYEVVEVELVP